MKFMKLMVVCLLGLASTAFAQQLKFPPQLDQLASKASEVVDVNMDRSMLAFASKSLSDKRKEDQEAKKLIGNLNGIYVRSFEFNKPGMYSAADVELVRSQLKAPQWSKIVNVRDKGEIVEIYCKVENGAVNGMAIIAAEARELTFVHIDGPIDPEQLSTLGGQFGIPSIAVPGNFMGAGKR